MFEKCEFLKRKKKNVICVIYCNKKKQLVFNYVSIEFGLLLIYVYKNRF